jgi:hypothetical protein
VKLEQAQWTNGTWMPTIPGKWRQAQLVLLFGAPFLLRQQIPYLELKQAYPYAHIIGCSTAGEIAGTHVYDNSLVATAIYFEHTTLHGLCLKLTERMSDLDAGKILSQHLDKQELVHVLVISDGVGVNGSAILCYADISHAKLIMTNFSMINAQHAIFRGTQFLKNDLIHANLSEADLSGANLSTADLFGSYLTRAVLA